MTKDPYSMSFTTGGLYLQESVNLAELFLEHNNWNIIRKMTMSNNILQSRTRSSLVRISREVISRLIELNFQEIELLATGTAQEQRHLLWIAICRRFSFIADFAVEALRERFIGMKSELEYGDYDAFFNVKAEWHTELDDISDTTRKKCRQVLFKILRESGLLSEQFIIQPTILSPRIVILILQKSRNDFLYFPLFDDDLRRWG